MKGGDDEMNGLEDWTNLGASAIMAGAFLFVLRWLVASYAEDKRRFLETVQNHMAHNTQALSRQMQILERLANAVDRLVEARR